MTSLFVLYICLSLHRMASPPQKAPLLPLFNSAFLHIRGCAMCNLAPPTTITTTTT
jgi:hypothetical protein